MSAEIKNSISRAYEVRAHLQIGLLSHAIYSGVEMECSG